MGLFAAFARKTILRDRAGLSAFLDRHAAFMVQKCIYEYARARSGLLSSKLLEEADFRAAAERAKWKNYPLCVEALAVMVEGVLRADAGDPERMRAGLVTAAASAWRAHVPPAGTDPAIWTVAEASLAERLARVAAAPPQPVKDIPLATADAFFANLPIHPDLRSYDFRLVTNNLRGNLLGAYEAFLGSVDAPALARSLAYRDAADGGASTFA